ncbi:carbohydrate-binding protein [Salmonella enterica subsp. enterica serovar Cerro]|nr:carbohydrate-binding protein [Salmonella enterica subsp. enterica serovar Cerro]EBX1743031.1 carbohydrate-binding protein [Salmonella enterica subsp. enterica serovar Cerro]ECG7108861.1 carbohydrate-binding protein [Salmonella enterica subsp. enterica serovar Cerro]EEI5162027.1 carbohydrate-binding protein [Salmonella enterica subsp. enterica serovar Cerro]
MSKIARYQGNVRAFASDAQGMERTVFGGTNQADDLTSQITASFLRGWGIVGASEHPSLEDFNAAMYAMSQFIAYQHQMGVPEWHAQQEYHIGSICTHNGESYQSLQDANVGSPPPSAKWTPVLTSKNGLANLHLGEAAKRDVGTGVGQIPDMSSFQSGGGWFKLPSGYVIQAFEASFDSNGLYINFPIPFPSSVIAIVPGVLMSTPASPSQQFPSIQRDVNDLTRFFAKYNIGGMNSSYFIAIGK